MTDDLFALKLLLARQLYPDYGTAKLTGKRLQSDVADLLQKRKTIERLARALRRAGYKRGRK